MSNYETVWRWPIYGGDVVVIAFPRKPTLQDMELFRRTLDLTIEALAVPDEAANRDPDSRDSGGES